MSSRSRVPGTAYGESKVPSSENPGVSRVPSLKPEVGEDIALLASSTSRVLHDSLNSIFPSPLPTRSDMI